MAGARKFSVLASALSGDAREAMSRSREMGFGGLVFDAHSGSLDLPALSTTGRREFGYLLKASGQTLVAVRADIGPKGFGPGADIDRLLAGLDRILQVARDLNAGAVTIDLGPLPEPDEPVKPKPTISPEQAGVILIPSSSTPEPPPPPVATRAPDRAFATQVDGALRALCEIAERYQIMIAAASSLASFASIDRAVRATACPWLGINLDPVAMLQDRWSIDEIFSRRGDSIIHVLARDAIRGDAGRIRSMPVGEGNVKWPELSGALDAADYRGWITFDPSELSDPATALRTGLARLSATSL